MKIIGIKAKNCYLLTDNIENKTYFTTKLGSLLFDGKSPKLTYKSDWYRLDKKPTKIQSLIKQYPINRRWELKDKSLSDKFKEVYQYEEVMVGYDVEDWFSAIKGLYDFKQDEQPDKLENIDFELDEILEIEEYKDHNGFKYKAAGQWSHENYPTVTEKNVKYDILTQVLTPPVLLYTQPCKLSRKESYDIVRKYIKENINNKVSEITSDYDFCFTVKKKILLAQPYSFQHDVNSSIFGKRKKKPKYETKYVDKKSLTVFEMCHEKYQSYTPIECFEGDNLDDLKSNIDSYLEELISVINKPLCECDKCNGSGVIETL